MLNALTIDVEDYFQVHAFSHVVRYEDWGNFESRVERNTQRILDLLAVPSNLEPRTLNLEPRTPVRATFFCLGWIAERYPHLIKEIQAQGHEIACHGYAHQLIYRQSREEFREDIYKAKGILEDIIGREVIGYRAPSYSITNNSLWAFEVLAEEGFKYDSSIFPIRHDFYGIPDAPRFPFSVSLNGKGRTEFKPLESTFNVEHRTLNLEQKTPNLEPSNPQSAIESPRTLNVEPSISNLEPQTLNLEHRTLNFICEFPLSTVRLANLNLPLSGGGYFRLIPYSLFKKGLKNINDRESRPFIFYLHPWEIDPDQPRIREAGLKSRLRHYVNLNKTELRFKTLLKHFCFSSIYEVLKINKSI